MSHVEHRAAAPVQVRCAVLTVSDTRTLENDASGRAITELLGAHGHEVVWQGIVRDVPAEVRGIVEGQLANPDVDAVITTGGTGLSSRDQTYEALVGLLDKRIDGFGELFRMLSYEEVGAAAMLSRACAGAARGRVVILLPGSERAVRLAMTRLVVPELGHLVREVSR